MPDAPTPSATVTVPAATGATTGATTNGLTTVTATPTAPASDFQPVTSQADLDRIIGTRLARERERYADYDAVKTKAAEYDKALEAAKSEQEKAVEAARKEGETSALQRANTRLISAEARALAAEARFAKPELAVRALDLSGVTVADDGSVDGNAIRAKLTELAESGAFVIDDGRRPAPKADKSQGSGGTVDGPSVDRGREMFAAKRGKKSA